MISSSSVRPSSNTTRIERRRLRRRQCSFSSSTSSRTSNASSNITKTVHFSKAEPQVKIIENAFTTQEEKLCLWYSHNDLLELRRNNNQEQAGAYCKNCRIRTSCQKDSTNKSSSSSTVTTGSCCHQAEQGCQRQRQHEFVVGLLRQQQEHKLMGVDDPKGLFQLSRACSKAARQKAMECARQQAKEVKSFEEMRQQTLSVVDDALELLNQLLY